MALKTIGAKITLEGEDKYRQALKDINAQHKLYMTELKSLKAQYKDNATSTEALIAKQNELKKIYDSQNSKVKLYTDALDNSKDNMKKAADAIENYKTELIQATDKLDEMKKSANSSNEEIEEQEKYVSELKTALTQTEGTYILAKNATNKWENGLNNANAELYNLNSEIKKNDAALEESKDSSKKFSDAMKKFSESLQESTDKSKVFGQVLLANITSDLILDAIDAIKDGISTMFTSMIENGSGFESAMSQVAATLGMTAEETKIVGGEFDALKEAASECGETTKYSATEAADALNYLALAGYDSQEAIEALPDILTLAAAGGMELADASDMVTDSMSALGLKTDDLDTFIDQLTKTSQKSNTSVSQLGEAILTVGGTATQLSGGVTEMNTVLGIFADNGIKALTYWGTMLVIA